MNRASINWQAVKSRVQSSEMALQETLARNSDHVDAVFHQRALRLAKTDTPDKSASTGSPALVFRLARERYAIELEELAEVLPFRGCTQVPGASNHFLGVINLRGEIRPVIDLGAVLSESPGGDSGFILILRRQVGLKVDDIEELREIHAEDLPQFIPGHFGRRLLCDTLTLLNVEALLSGAFSQKESFTR